MKIWRALIYLAAAWGNLGAQDAGTSNQLNRLRFLQGMISFADAELLKDESLQISLSSGMSYTTNANLVSGGMAGDFYATNMLGARWQRDAGEGFGFSAGVASPTSVMSDSPG